MLRLDALAAALSVLVLSTVVDGCSKPLSHEQCSGLLDRYVTLLVHSDRPDAKAEEIQHLQVQARAKAARDPAFARCAVEVSQRQWHCAMKAPDADSLERCLLSL